MSAEKNIQQKKDFKENILAYFKGVKAEFGKVSWPVRQEVVVETGIVIAVVTFFTVVVFLMDLIFKALLDLIK